MENSRQQKLPVKPVAVADRAFAPFTPELRVEQLRIPLFGDEQGPVYLIRADKAGLLASDGQLPGYHVTGNKFFKLLPNVQWASEQGFNRLISFGGCWSNHLHAVAAAGQHFGLQTVGIVRGERPRMLTPTLVDAQTAGMRLQFVPRSQYRKIAQEINAAELQRQFGRAWIVPPGGSNSLGVAGAGQLGQLIARALPAPVSELFLASGTGGTLAGIVAGLQQARASGEGAFLPQRVSGVNVLRNPELEAETSQFLAQISPKTGTASQQWRVLNRFHGGGYARVNKELEEFLYRLEAELGEAVDHVYMAKVFYAAWSLQQSPASQTGGAIAILHTGGQQGRRGMSKTPADTGKKSG